MDVTYYTIKHLILCDWFESPSKDRVKAVKKIPFWKKLTPLKWLRVRIDQIQVSDPALAHRICQLIPAQCPFARDLKWFGQTLVTIPPLCKINPLYEELMALRWRALCYLADECGQDISAYC
ncbi:Mo-dependent nitrogenase C-terminal domain-containing protein [Gloeothece verrucosa]|uniref:Mo-dependent nitrogenase family protein n=1 Tax=Gloeothece verrucosa (strain PCC 7822) TaxID=497965 RepID=E0U7R1_GLOV7|nr:Mo-dependent nitrogenase C-terminal domain-containing protein [Gloeothece verrucosa]ADN14873.1 Mo-dependent nitrogenase family protein [Gloeothece verrucosa PCC 7822]